MKKTLLIILLIWISIILFICVYRIKMGYYPIPEIVRRMYYVNKICNNKKTGLQHFKLANNFKVNQIHNTIINNQLDLNLQLLSSLYIDY